MTYSMNEIEALARKAARGAGMSWGLAEETGKAVRCLAEYGVDAAGLLAALLRANDRAEYARIAPFSTDGVWTAPGGVLCPIATGASLGDHAALPDGGPHLTLGPTAYPVFLVPFALIAARRTDRAIALTWEGVTVHVSPAGVHVDGAEAALLRPEVPEVTCRSADHAAGRALARIARAEMSHAAAACLNGFAHRTYAPATEASRLSGAGAGLSDND